MYAAGFRLLRQAGLLSRQQRSLLIESLRPALGLDQVCEAIDGARSAPLCCPGCGNSRHYRHGIVRGLQRYRCRACGRTFSALTGTPLARLRHRSKWLDYLRDMLDSRSVRAAAKRIGVHRNTSFRWRHRFLDGVRLDQPERLIGIAEADEMFILESQKGSRRLGRPARKRGGHARTRGISQEHDCILVARDRAGQTCSCVTGRAAVTARQLHRHLRPVLDPDVLLVTDGHVAYRTFAREARIAHAFVNLRAGERMRGAVHVQNVNAYHQRLRSWLSRFHGVASRYLPNYLGWRWALDEGRIGAPDHLLRTAIGLFHIQ
ncbi:IS1595 family transposase [Massilia sp. IC2-476]|uniref:IS1595 family transposase n=1 Tax=Massilia sp. IC2-476 TaxID=2887199 RepID=UPI001D107456|nr:IS1595 family transposase [Massilia sp. IC2-476]MCC2973113.1 IS1595 family transposase [Massilia sp. IC2-476]